MQLRVQKWGNSLAVRIPKAFAKEVGLGPDTLVNVTLSVGKLVVSPVAVEVPTLEEMLARITPETLHGETDWGPPVGSSSWTT